MMKYVFLQNMLQKNGLNAIKVIKNIKNIKKSQNQRTKLKTS